MRDHDHATALLGTLADHRDEHEFAPDSPFARASLERILATPPLPAPRLRHRNVRRAAFAAVPLALAALAIAIVPSLGGGSRSGTAQAAVIARAAAALAPPNSILHLQVSQYTSDGMGPCMLAGPPPNPTTAGGQLQGVMCVGESKPTYPSAGISADPANDTLTDSYQEWVSADGSQDHTVYNNGDETVNDSATQQYESYDAADDTVTTLTDEPAAPATTQPGSGQALAIPSAASLEDPSYYENLYQQAQAGQLGAQLVGQTTIDGESVYELQFEIDPAPPANPPAGDMCGTSICTPPDREILLYLDSQTYTPVRTVMLILNASDLPGIPAGTSVNSVTDFTVQTLPDTSANQALLAISPPPGATQIQETQAQWQAQMGAELQASVAANVARAGGTASAQAASASHRRGHTASAGQRRRHSR